MSVGALYGIVRTFVRIDWPLGALLLATAAMAASDIPAASLGATDPRKWTPADWASDAVPHLAYGLCTAFAFEMANRDA